MSGDYNFLRVILDKTLMTRVKIEVIVRNFTFINIYRTFLLITS